MKKPQLLVQQRLESLDLVDDLMKIDNQSVVQNQSSVCTERGEEDSSTTNGSHPTTAA